MTHAVEIQEESLQETRLYVACSNLFEVGAATFPRYFSQAWFVVGPNPDIRFLSCGLEFRPRTPKINPMSDTMKIAAMQVGLSQQQKTRNETLFSGVRPLTAPAGVARRLCANFTSSYELAGR